MKRKKDISNSNSDEILLEYAGRLKTLLSQRDKAVSSVCLGRKASGGLATSRARHILGQPWAIEHTEIHWEMLKFGIRIKSVKEIVGQIPRLLIGGVKSFVGKIPVGNTGGSNVPPLRPMEIPEDIKQWMEPYMD